MQIFHINQNSTLPYLTVAMLDDGRYDFNKFNECIQDASITFSMVRADNGRIKIAEEPCEIRIIKDSSCQDKYAIVYKWRERDTKEKGAYIGTFNITFNGNITSATDVYPVGKLLVPIKEKIIINIE